MVQGEGAVWARVYCGTGGAGDVQGVPSPEQESRIIEEVHSLNAEHQSAQQKVMDMQTELER
jgi:hypothetical protein